MKQFEYEWWDIDILYTFGKTTFEVKAKNKANAIRQIKNEIKDEAKFIKEVYWETLRLDRTGHQR